MNGFTRRIVLGLSATAIAVSLASGALIAGQNSSPTQGPGGRGGPGRFGGPGGPGGAFGRGRGGPMGVLGPMMIERLDLSQDQRDRMRQILESHRDEQRTLADRSMAAHDALEVAVAAPSFDESLIRARSADVAVVEADETVFRARVYAEVFQILTSEQQTKLKSLQAERQQRQDQMRSNRRQK